VHLSDNQTVVNEFEHQMKELTRIYSEAKDNVKFLTTLERQFKNLATTEGLTTIEETLPSLMNGLRLVWIISRHFKEEEQMQNLLQTISSKSF
jgi:dynein heavy chain